MSIFAIADTKLYATVVTLSIQDNAKLLEQLKCRFRVTINWSKYQSKVTMQIRNQYLDYLIDPNFQRGNNLLVLSNENIGQRASFRRYLLSTVKIKDCSIMIDGKNFFSQLLKSNLRTYDNI